MSIGETFSRLLLKRLVDDVFLSGGVEALDAVMDFLIRCGQLDDPRLTSALEQAMQGAWCALEEALGDESSRDHGQSGLAHRDNQALRHCLQRVLNELAHGGAGTCRSTARLVDRALRRQCLEDLHSARAGGALAGCLDREEWARSHEVFGRFAASQGRRDTRRRTEGQLLRDLEQHGCVGLMRLLTTGAGLPLLLTAARALVCQELAHLLYRCLQENPEQTPDRCTLVLDSLHELSSPRFSIWRSPALPVSAAPVMPVHWSRLESGSHRGQRGRPSPRQRPDRSVGPRYVSCRKQRAPVANPRASWALAAVLMIGLVLMIVLPIWLLLENAQRYEGERQRVMAERQRIRNERHRVEEERQRLIDAQRQTARQEAARQHALQQQREVEERRRRLEAEEERQRAEERAVQLREEQRRRQEQERRALLREKQQRLQRAQAALEEGLTYAALRKDEEALAAFTETILLDPNLSRAWSARGVVRRRMGDFVGALEDFRETVRRDPGNVRCWFQCGELHTARREYRPAIEAFSSVLRRDPDNIEAYRQRGLCHAGNDDVENALADQTKAITLAPTDPWAYFYRADLHRRRNHLVRAFEDYTAAIDRDPTHLRGLAGAYRGRGMLSLHWRNYEQAIRDLTRALELDPADTAALRARGTAYLHRGDWNKSLTDADGLLRQHADDNAAYKLRGQAYLALGEYRRADEDLTRAVRGGGDAETYYLRACVKVRLGDFKAAIFDCNDATSINPRLASAFYLRGKLNLHEGYRLSGLDDCRTAHELDPQFPLP